MRDLLEIKRVHHKIVDFNRDARQAGTGEAETKAINKLMKDKKLQMGDDEDLVLPQIFIDGNYIGDADDLQGLEDDALLDNILMRKACVACNNNRSTQSTKCTRCDHQFRRSDARHDGDQRGPAGARSARVRRGRRLL